MELNYHVKQNDNITGNSFRNNHAARKQFVATNEKEMATTMNNVFMNITKILSLKLP